MEVSMDGLRNHLLRSYNSLVSKLNSRIDGDDITDLEIYDIEKEIEGIRNCVVTLAFTSLEGEGGWKAMDEDTYFEQFNPEKELED